MLGKLVDVVHLKLVKEKSVIYGGLDMRKVRIMNPGDAVKLASSFFEGCDKEMVYVCALNANMNPINISQVCVGSMCECRIQMSEIFKTAILSNCCNIICFHNHLSDNPYPSDEDKIITLKMQFLGKMLGIKLQDHIIIVDNGQYYSFQESGIITDGEWSMDMEEELAS